MNVLTLNSGTTMRACVTTRDSGPPCHRSRLVAPAAAMAALRLSKGEP